MDKEKKEKQIEKDERKQKEVCEEKKKKILKCFKNFRRGKKLSKEEVAKNTDMKIDRLFYRALIDLEFEHKIDKLR